ncbi:MAG: hypothetical protein M5U28_25920 [Sandaracinaceae bacterium]|nr:hypothetical protein [Sandaracinaceae bacterium]
MKLPESILRHLRGPIAAAALAGCSSSPAAPPPEPARIEPEAAPAPAPDPVAYDAEAESERLARLDRERAAEEHRRERRIADAQPRVTFGGLGAIGVGRRWDLIHAACGRG